MDERLSFPATERNRGPIGEVLAKILPQSGSVLEIASGSGEHGVTFQRMFPTICWQTSDPNPSYRKSIIAWIKHQELTSKMPNPIDLDVKKRPWPLTPEFQSSLKAIVCINMLHVSPWPCTQAIFEESRNLLQKGQLLMFYGSFKINGKHTSQSNLQFDQALQVQNTCWGLRDLGALSETGLQNGFEKLKIIEMPANNLSVIFQMQ